MIDPTPGSSAVTATYATVAELRARAAKRIPAAVWVLAVTDDEVLESALLTAADLFDLGFQWNGVATFPGQRRSFPRTGLTDKNGVTVDQSSIPHDVKLAHLEYTIQFGLGNLLEVNKAKALGLTKLKAGPAEFAWDHGITSSVNMVSYVPDPVSRFIPTSWYTLPEPRKKKAVFRVF